MIDVSRGGRDNARELLIYMANDVIRQCSVNSRYPTLRDRMIILADINAREYIGMVAVQS